MDCLRPAGRLVPLAAIETSVPKVAVQGAYRRSSAVAMVADRTAYTTYGIATEHCLEQAWQWSA